MYNKDEFLNYFKNKYSNYNIDKTALYKPEEIRRLFTMEELSNIIVNLENDRHWNYVQNLIEYSSAKVYKQIIIYFSKNNPKILNKIISKDIYTNEELVMEIYENMYDFSKPNSDVKNNLKYDELDFYNYILNIRNSYKNHNLSEEERLEFINKIGNCIKVRLEYVDDNVLMEILGYILSGDINIYQLYKLINQYCTVEDYIGVGKFNINKIININIHTLLKVKKSYIENLEKILINNKIKIDYKIINKLIKMVGVLGYSNAEKILRYNHRVEEILRSFNIDLTEYDNIIKEGFVNFYVGKSIKDPNNLINTIYDKKYSNIRKNLDFIFNSWESIEIRFKTQSLETKTSFIENLLNSSKFILDPDEINIEGEIVNSYIDNKQFLRGTTLEVVKNLRENYKLMRHNYCSYIPYIKGKHNGFTYETLRADDPTLFLVGSKTGCCFRLNGDAESFVKYCETPYARVMVIRDKKDDICAMIPMVRNGNMVMANSIESIYVRNIEFMKLMFEVFEVAAKEIINISEKNESVDEHLLALIISSYKNEIDKFLNLESVKQINYSLVSPMDDRVYANMGGFDWINYFISKRYDFSYNNVRSFTPKQIYLDPREEIVELEEEQVTDKVVALLNSISYESDKKLINIDNLYRVIFNKDWYIILNKDYTIECSIVSKDKRAHIEYETYLQSYVEFARECEKEKYNMI